MYNTQTQIVIQQKQNKVLNYDIIRGFAIIVESFFLNHPRQNERQPTLNFKKGKFPIQIKQETHLNPRLGDILLERTDNNG